MKSSHASAMPHILRISCGLTASASSPLRPALKQTQEARARSNRTGRIEAHASLHVRQRHARPRADVARARPPRAAGCFRPVQTVWSSDLTAAPGLPRVGRCLSRQNRQTVSEERAAVCRGVAARLAGRQTFARTASGNCTDSAEVLACCHGNRSAASLLVLSSSMLRCEGV